MSEIFTAPACTPFSVAILVMLVLAVLELLMALTGLSVNDVVDDLVMSNFELDTAGDAHSGMKVAGVPETDAGAFGRFLAWLYVGRVPVLMVLIVFLTVFGLGGLALQAALQALAGIMAPAVLAAPVMLVASLPLVRACTGVLARAMPRDESNAVDADTFVGRTAVVTGGVAREDLPAQARLTDEFGTTHYVLIEPDEKGDALQLGEVVLLVRRISGSRFAAIHNPNEALVDRE